MVLLVFRAKFMPFCPVMLRCYLFGCAAKGAHENKSPQIVCLIILVYCRAIDLSGSVITATSAFEIC
jgi:hypothetical protein